MFNFPSNFYTDVRIEDVFETNIVYTLGNLDESRERKYKAAFIRLFDGNRWYYSATTDIDNIQKEIDNLNSLATSTENINNNSVVKKFEVNKGKFLKFEKDDISKVPKAKKNELIKNFFPFLKREKIKTWKTTYIDKKKVKEFYSSKGSELITDYQQTGFVVFFQLTNKDGKQFNEMFKLGSNYFSDLLNKEKECESFISKCEDFLEKSKPVKPGKYTVILSPTVAGVFAHESFGHKSEADFMLGDETMKKEWAIGKKIAYDSLSIVDDGQELGVGYTPYDDEGSKAKKTFLIKDGELAGRLHSTNTATDLNEQLTGNARSINFEFEPIVRMTTTYIMPGDKTKEKLFSEIKEGIYVEDLKHGSGMSTFTIAPSLAYMIKDGKVTDPVNISVITGNVFETLGEIDGLSNKLELVSFVGGGCGKMEQGPLPVGFGGPYVRVKNMNIQ